MDTPDYMTREGAHLLRQRIVAFWAKRGKKAVVEVQRISRGGRDVELDGRFVYELRSNVADLLATRT